MTTADRCGRIALEWGLTPVAAEIQPRQRRGMVLLRLLQLWVMTLPAVVVLLFCNELAMSFNPNGFARAILKTVLMVGAADFLLRRTRRRSLALGRVDAGTLWRTLLLLLSVELVAEATVVIYQVVSTATPFVFSIQPWHWSASLLEGTLLAPVYEEALFRGWLLEWLEGKAGSMLPGTKTGLACNIACSVTFGLLHLLGRPAFPVLRVCAAAALSIVLGLAKQRSKGIILPVLLHTLYNMIGVSLG